MKLRNNFIIFIFLNSCATNSFYKVITQEKYRAEIIISSDRIISECIDLEDPQKERFKKGKFLLYFHVLDDTNSVIRIGRDNIHERSGCFEKKSKVDKIIGKSKKIYIGGMANLNDPRKPLKSKYTFKNLGAFQETDFTFEFALMKGDNGQCFKIFEGSECEWNGFPIKKFPF
jgi:hypothetical protein